MIVGFSKYGTGPGDKPVNYMTDPEEPGRAGHPPQVLRGDPEVIRRLIDAIPNQHKYSSGVLSFSPGEELSDEQQNDIMDGFERTAFPGLRKDQYRCLWVRHVHTDRLELHFLIPRIELTTLKALNVRPPGPRAEERYDTFRSMINARYGLSDPDDPARSRLVRLPDFIAKRQAKAERSGAELEQDPRQIITDFLLGRIKSGLISNRDQLVAALKEQGFEIPRMGAGYITVLDPGTGNRWRLKGAIYEDKFRSLKDIETAIAGRAGTFQGPNPQRAEKLAKELDRLLAPISIYNKTRYRSVERGRDLLPAAESAPFQDGLAVPGSVPGVGPVLRRHAGDDRNGAADHRPLPPTNNPGQQSDLYLGRSQPAHLSVQKRSPLSLGRRRAIDSYRVGLAAIKEDQPSPKQRFKLRLLASLYQVEFSQEFASLLHWVRARPSMPEIVLALNDGRRIRDSGSRILLQGQHDENAVRLMVNMALAKGWQKFTTTGPQSFREAIRAEGHRLGLTVDGIPPPSIPIAPNKEAVHVDRSGTGAAQSSQRRLAGGCTTSRRIDEAVERTHRSVRRLDEALLSFSRVAERGLKRKMDNNANELDRFKQDINLAAFAASKGFAKDKAKSTRNSLVMRHETGDKIVITRQPSGHWTYFSVRDDLDNGTIIDFLQKRTGMKLGEVRKLLRPWIGASPPVSDIEFYVRVVTLSAKDSERMLKAWHRSHPASQDHTYIMSRGVGVALADPRFQDRIHEDGFGNALFPHIDPEGNLTGFELRNFDHKEFSAGGTKGLWLSNVHAGDTKLVICESPIDCMAYHLLHGDEQTRYLATGGSMSSRQKDMLEQLAGTLPDGLDIMIATDNDEAGHRLARDLEALLSPYRPICIVQPGASKDWAEELTAKSSSPAQSLSGFNRPR